MFTGISEAYKELVPTSEMELSVKLVNGLKYFFQGLILDIWPSSEYVCVYDNYLFVFTLYFVSGMVQP